jgi:hypothetical protein
MAASDIFGKLLLEIGAENGGGNNQGFASREFMPWERCMQFPTANLIKNSFSRTH